MTEKRFDVIYEEDEEYKNIRYWEIIDRKNNAKTSNELKLCHLLNLLNEENEQLKKQIEELKVDLKMAKIDGAIDRMAQRPMRW